MAEIPVTGRVLTWAREFRGLSIKEAAERLSMSVDELEEYEKDTKMPTLTKFEKFASTYRLPQATLFRKTPPANPKLPKDFRTFDGANPSAGFDFLVALSNVRTLQSTLHRLDEEDEEFVRPDFRAYNMRHDPFEQGENERAAIGVTVEQQLKWAGDSGFRHWRAIIERLGIAVYLQKFDIADCRGCSLWDDTLVPAIVINKAEESENARTFTLIHEYAHLLVRQPGISDQKNADPTEAFCNRFAAAFLMPVSALRRVLAIWPPHVIDWGDETIRNAARALNVSPQALALRLEELGKAHQGMHRRFVFRGKPRTKPPRVSYVTKRLSEIGGRYASTVVSALDREIIDNVEASQALAVKPTSMDRVRDYVTKQQELARAE